MRWTWAWLDMLVHFTGLARLMACTRVFSTIFLVFIWGGGLACSSRSQHKQQGSHQLYGCWIAAKRRKFTARGRRVLPHMDYAGMCRWTGHGLSAAIRLNYHWIETQRLLEEILLRRLNLFLRFWLWACTFLVLLNNDVIHLKTFIKKLIPGPGSSKFG